MSPIQNVLVDKVTYINGLSQMNGNKEENSVLGYLSKMTNWYHVGHYKVVPHFKGHVHGTRWQSSLSITSYCPSCAGPTQILNHLTKTKVGFINVVVIFLFLKIRDIVIIIDIELVKCNRLALNLGLEICVLISIGIELPKNCH